MREADRDPAASSARRRCEAWIGLGANLGDARATLDAAVAALAALPETRLLACSSLYRSAPIDASGPNFVNAVARIETLLDAEELLAQLLAIERRHGRERPYRNAPRTLDLDLLLYGQARIESPALTVPHPRLHARAFVLAPLAELAPDLHVPGRGTVAALLACVRAQPIERLAHAAQPGAGNAPHGARKTNEEAPR